MHIHEYQGKELLRKFGVRTPAGYPCMSPDEAAAAAERLGGDAWVVKAQVHAGGRAKAGGVRFARSIDEVRRHADGILGMRLMTAQGAPGGHLVRQLLVEEGADIVREMYVAFTIDRDTQRIALLACADGGIDIDEVLARAPGTVHREYVDAGAGLTAAQAEAAARRLNLPEDAVGAARDALLALYRAFDECDASLAEINPLVLTRDHRVIAVDARFDIDPNALFRHPDLAAMHDAADDDPDEAEATRAHLTYVGLDGNIGCLVNGAGLAMATMDVLRLHGGAPANLLELGDDATAAQVVEAFALMARKPNLAAILVHVLGAGMECDVVAQGFVQAARDVRLARPVVVRLKGANESAARKRLARSGLPVVVADDMADAAVKAVRAASRS
jgi:succinyl-CoA synthetase beta subunit